MTSDDSPDDCLIEDAAEEELRVALLCAKRMIWDEENFSSKLKGAARGSVCGSGFYTSFLADSQARQSALQLVVDRIVAILKDRKLPDWPS